MLDARTANILIIDDETAVRRFIRTYLERSGFHAIEAEDGRAGLEIFKRENPDLVLIDLGMPGVSGLEVLAEITRSSPQIPSVVVSGTVNIEDAIRALQLGAWDFIQKPIQEIAILHHTILKSLERARLRRANREYQRHLEETLQKLREDEEAGRRIQMKLLPPISSTMGEYTLTRYLLASTYLSGDFVDYFEINDEWLAFYAADVSGHGVSSALVTVLLKSFMRKYLERHKHRNDATILSPAALLHALNAEIISENLEKHVTIFYGLLAKAENTLTFANGGYFPFPLIWSYGHAEFIGKSGTAVGLFPFAEYHDRQMQLPGEFFLAVLSDGVLDLMPQKSIVEKMEYIKSLGMDIEGYVSQLGSTEALQDDLTLLAIRKSKT